MKKTVSIEGMSCMHCVKRVQTALAGVSGVTRAEVNLEKKIATVEGEALNDETLTSAVVDAGYQVTKIN